MKQGKKSFEGNVNIENTASNFSKTAVRYLRREGKFQIQEIRVGDTSMRLAIQDTSADH